MGFPAKQFTIDQFLVKINAVESQPRFFWFFAFLSPCISFVIFPMVQLISSPILRREARKWCGQHSINYHVTLTKDNQTKSTKISVVEKKSLPQNTTQLVVLKVPKITEF